MATLTVNMPSVVNSITFTNGNTASNQSGTGYISYSSAVKISSVFITGRYSSWSGTLYWSNGTNTFAFATVNNGSASVYSTSSQESIDYTGNRTITVTAVQSSATLTVNMPSVVNSITFTNGNTATNRSGTGYISYSSAVKIQSVSIAGGYSSWSGTLYWSNGTNTYAFATVNNGSVSVYSTSSQESIDYTGNRTITVTAVQSSTTIYYKYRYIVESTGATLEDSSVYSVPTELSPAVAYVTLSNIPQPTNTDYIKTGSYIVVAHCSINHEYGYASCSGTSASDPSIIGVKVQFARFTWLGSDLQDNAAFASGKYISDAITASGWNAMYAKIKELAEATGGQFDYDAVSKGDAITATEFNYMRLGIINLPWHGSLPNAVAAGMPIFADYFNGSVSLKSALNAAIDEFNKQ